MSLYGRFLSTFKETMPTGPREILTSSFVSIYFPTAMADQFGLSIDQLQQTRDLRLLNNRTNLPLSTVICCELE